MFEASSQFVSVVLEFGNSFEDVNFPQEYHLNLIVQVANEALDSYLHYFVMLIDQMIPYMEICPVNMDYFVWNSIDWFLVFRKKNNI